MQSTTWLKYVAYIVAGLLALWILGAVLQMIGGLLSGLTLVIWRLLRFLFVAGIIVGVVYLVVQLLTKKPKT